MSSRTFTVTSTLTLILSWFAVTDVSAQTIDASTVYRVDPLIFTMTAADGSFAAQVITVTNISTTSAPRPRGTVTSLGNQYLLPERSPLLSTCLESTTPLLPGEACTIVLRFRPVGPIFPPAPSTLIEPLPLALEVEYFNPPIMQVTLVRLVAVPTAVPTLSEWSLMVLAGLLVWIGFRRTQVRT